MEKPIIAKEGWFYIATLTIFTLILALNKLVLLTIIFTFITLFVIQFFRDPQRIIDNTNMGVVSPADGRVIAIEKCQNPYTGKETIRISIFMNIFNVHSNIIPIAGTISKIVYSPGKFFNASLNKASSENERNALIINTVDNTNVTVVQIAGLIARRIICYLSANNNVVKGQRFGFIKFGSRVDVYLPLEYYICVTLGQKVLSGNLIAKVK